MNFREMTKDQLAEESLINLTHAILEEKRTSVPLNDLLETIKELTGLKDAEIKRRLVQFYTDLNVDGRFLFNQENGWGLREWFKVEQIEEETAPSVKTHKKKAKAILDDEDDLDLDLEEDDIDFDEDYEEFVEEDLEGEKVDIVFDDDEDEIEEIPEIPEIEEIEEIDEEFIEEEFEVEDELEEDDL